MDNENKSGEALVTNQRIGEILVKYTSLTQEQLEEALKIKDAEGGRLGDILLAKKFVLPHEMMRALCVQMDLKYVDDLKTNDIDPQLVANIPINYAKTRGVIPIARNDAYATVAISDPFNLESLEDMRVFFKGLDIRPVISSPMRIQEAINRVYEKTAGEVIQNIGDEDEDYDDLDSTVDILDSTEDEAPVIRFVNSLIHRAVKEKASDIHIEPFEKEIVVRFRIDGVLQDILHQPKKVHAAVSSRIKIMSNLDIAEKRLPQDGRIFRKVAGKEIDIRLSTIPTQFGERLVMRLLEKGGELLSLDRLGFAGESLNLIERLIHRENGIFLITGPTGSGKSTTMAACLTRINTPDLNILTVEDPIEYQLDGVGQVAANAKIDLTFAKALRSFLRQDPDVIMVGEIRDSETAELAITASLTGHLVFSTMHTNDAAGAFPRLIDMGIEPFLVASSIVGVMGQRLMRRVCTKCREPYEADQLELQEMGLTPSKGTVTLYRAKGCSSCNNTGYSGRINVHEILEVDDIIRALIMKNVDAGQIKKAAVSKGMVSMREDGARKVLAGLTTVQELARTLSMGE
jgi:general secretion pathway protein E